MRNIAIHTRKTPPQALRYQSTGHVERSEIPHHGIGKRDRETGLDYRLARFYDSDAGRFLSTDPLADARITLSPYNYVQNNPVSRTDPTGALDAPIYDIAGNFLGTDDQGLQGKAIVMNRENFTQGMYHRDALMNSLGVEGLKSNDAKDKLLNHYNGLKERPDYDGYLTIYEALKWYNRGTGEPLFIDINKLNFGSSQLSINDFRNHNNIRVNFFYKYKDGVLNKPASDLNLAAVYGEIKLKLLNTRGDITVLTNKESGAIDRFDFSSPIFKTIADFAYPGKTKSFNIYGYNTGNLKNTKPSNPGTLKPFEPKF